MIYLNESIRKQMIENAEKTYPQECCGFLLGNEREQNRYISKILIIENSFDGDQKRTYSISSKDYMSAEKLASLEELDLLGVYHSHPDHPSLPSEYDRKDAQPFFSYIILSIYKKRFNSIQSWRLNDQFQFEEEFINEH